MRRLVLTALDDAELPKLPGFGRAPRRLVQENGLSLFQNWK